MTFEDALAAALKDLVSEPPHDLDPGAAKRSRAHVARIAAPLAAAAVIIVLAVTIVAISRHHQHPDTGTVPGHQGRLSGQILAVGGPALSPPRPLRGTVTITEIRGPGRTTRTLAVGADGRYAVDLPAGTYSVSAFSPQVATTNTSCPAPGPVTLRAGSHAVANAYCQER